jgi:ceramide glucosyltransferase
MILKFVLAAWSAAGIAWWLIAWRLVRREGKAVPLSAGDVTGEKLTIFKPLAPLGTAGLEAEAAGLESFVAQLDAQSEMLLGFHEAEREIAAPFLKKMERLYPHARVKAVFRSAPDETANPKVAWQKFLAPHAEGSLWLWSDTDIIAPPGFLCAARAEWAALGAALLTFPYVVRETVSGPALLDALFVNVEFYPGVLLLRRRGPVDFGLGAGLLFRRDDFLSRVGWEEPGAALADDFVLGQRLGPVRISAITLATTARESTWRAAWRHYLRWSKTVAWNRPGGAAARLAILPVCGWLLAVILHPARLWPWAGLFTLMQVDVYFAALLCRQIGQRWSPRDWATAEIWTLGRVVVWIACWLPGPVNWRGQIWHGPRLASPKTREGIDNHTSANDGLSKPSIGRHA